MGTGLISGSLWSIGLPPDSRTRDTPRSRIEPALIRFV